MRAARPPAPAAVQAGTPSLPSGTMTQCCPGGRCQRKAHTPLAWAIRSACMGPASRPMKAIELAVDCSSVPAVGVITNQTSLPLTGVLDVWARAWTSRRPENGPRTPWEATTSSDSGIWDTHLRQGGRGGTADPQPVHGHLRTPDPGPAEGLGGQQDGAHPRDPWVPPGHPGQHGDGPDGHEQVDRQVLEQRLGESPPGGQDGGQQADRDQGRQRPEQDADRAARQQRGVHVSPFLPQHLDDAEGVPDDALGHLPGAQVRPAGQPTVRVAG